MATEAELLDGLSIMLARSMDELHRDAGWLPPEPTKYVPAPKACACGCGEMVPFDRGRPRGSAKYASSKCSNRVHNKVGVHRRRMLLIAGRETSGKTGA
jgi:hypothetical protein